jgi:hypothetical protein
MIFGFQLLRNQKWMDLELCLKDFQSRWAFQCRSQCARNKLKKAALHVIAGQMTDSQIKDGAFAKGLALEGVEPKVETILLKEATVTETAPGKLKMLWRFAFVAEIASPLQQLCKF